MKHKGIALFLVGMIFLAGLFYTTFPIWNGFLLSRELSEQIQLYLISDKKKNQEEGNDDPLRKDMENYNRQLYQDHQRGFNGRAAYEQPSFTLADYGYDSEIFGVLSIPKIKLEMPIYLGASTDNLALGVAHLGQTSLPIGGSNTHSVLAGHRGWKGAAYFKFIPDLRKGDEVQITNPWETLTYQVVDITVVYSGNTESLYIQPGRDLVTLMTCDYGESGLKLRCLVTCERVSG